MIEIVPFKYENDKLNVYEGRTDFELTELGHKQTLAMAKYVSKEFYFIKIYSSHLKQAIQTAKHFPQKLEWK